MTNLRARRLGLLGLAVSLMLGVAACSTMSDVGDGIASMDPTGLLGGDSSSDATPDLANVPPPPAGASTPDQQTQIASAVTADGSKAQYSADALRAGTEASAAPPPPPVAGDTPGATIPVQQAPVQQALAAPPPSASPPSASDLPPSASDALPSAAPSASEAAPSASDAPPSASDAAPSAAEPAAAAPSAVPAVAASAPVRTAAIPSGAEPAVPAVPPGNPMRGGMTAPVMSDAALGFHPSSAPQLNSTMNQWVSSPILNHYRQTASLSRSIGGGNPNAAVPSGSGLSPASLNGGIPATATVFFPGDGTTLSAAGRAQIRTAVSAFKAQGGTGTLRVVGHSSSRTANMPVEKHLELIFDKSQKRASAVAQELIHDGVPAAQVMVEAVGDSQPVYYESMPKGEDGNRRAEIYLQ